MPTMSRCAGSWPTASPIETLMPDPIAAHNARRRPVAGARCIRMNKMDTQGATILPTTLAGDAH